MSSIGIERFLEVEGVDSDAAFDVAFIGGEQGPNSAQQRQNQHNEDGAPCPESTLDEVAFIGGEQGANPMQMRQNEHNDDQGGAPCPPPSVYSAGMSSFVEGGTDLLAAHHMPDTSMPPATVNYLGGTMLI